MIEEWKVIPMFPNYEASNTGLIRRKLNGKVLKSNTKEEVRDYKIVSLFFGKKKYTKQVSKLIWEAFNDCECKMTIDHIDRNPSNNNIENLRCVTHKENSNNRDNYSSNRYNLTDEDKKTIINKLKSKEWTTWTVMKKYRIPTNYTHMVLKRGTWNKYLDEQSEVSTIKRDCKKDL